MSDFQPITVDGENMVPNGAQIDEEGRVWLIRYARQESE